jgi:hypothetical protein
MDKVVPCLIPYNSVFYLKFFDQDKANFLLNQIMFSLEIRFKSKSALFFRARPSSFSPPLVGPRAVHTHHPIHLPSCALDDHRAPLPAPTPPGPHVVLLCVA